MEFFGKAKQPNKIFCKMGAYLSKALQANAVLDLLVAGSQKQAEGLFVAGPARPVMVSEPSKHVHATRSTNSSCFSTNFPLFQIRRRKLHTQHAGRSFSTLLSALRRA